MMYEVNYNSWTSYVSSCFCCLIRPEGLLYTEWRVSDG